MIGIDTCVLTDIFKEDPSLKYLLSRINDELCVNQITYLEIIIGLDPDNTKHQKEEIFYDQLFSSFLNYDLDLNASKLSRKIFWDLKKTGNFADLLDCAIAGIYLSNGVNTIITKNKKHFEKIKDMKVLSY